MTEIIDEDELDAESAAARDERRGVARLEAFSDGVFAIAITLLVLGIEVPDVDPSDLGDAISSLDASIWAYFLGFAVIGLFWVGHHSFFGEVERHNNKLLWTNMLFLSLIAAMPFTTGLIGEYGRTETATILFAANVALAGFASYLSEWAAIRDGLVDAGSRVAGRPALSAGLIPPIVFSLSIPIAAFIDVTAAQWFWLLTLITARSRRH